VRTTAHAMKVTAVAAGLAFPHAAQASPAGLAAIIRGHWMIEDRLHWVRDLDFDEDRSQIRTASAPQVMAALRNLAITILQLAGHASIATRTSPPRPQAGPAPTDDHELLMLTLPRPWPPDTPCPIPQTPRRPLDKITAPLTRL
jgi:hypothetical protein